MILIVTALLVVFCLVSVWIILSSELASELAQKKNNGIEANDIYPSKWTSIEPGPDSLYPIQEENENTGMNKRR